MPHIETDVELKPITESDLQISDMDGALIVRPRMSRVPSNQWLELFSTAYSECRDALLNNAGLQAMAGGRLQYVTSTGVLAGGTTISERAHEAVKAVVAATNALAVKHNADEDEEHRQAAASVQARKEAFEQAKKAMIGK